ncbi:MAG TPA: TetR/AcrR family transcriptional regulator [Proteobacteria bacterium]|nr:TetR/AcrR family transcriptional regulator [Pseudomonadota bacterium]
MVSRSEREGVKRNGKRDRILQAAERVFTRFGYKKATMQEIAAEAGISKGAIYMFFKSKEELFKTLVRRNMRKWWEIIEKAAKAKSDPRDKIRAATLAKLTYAQKFVSAKRLSERHFEEARQFIEKELEWLEEREAELLERMFIEGQRQKIFVRVPDVKLVAFALVRAMREFEVPWVFAGRKISTRKKVDLLMNLLFKGIEVRPSSS